MKFETVRITDITIVHGFGADLINLTTDLPDGVYPYEGFAYMKLAVAADTAEAYCKQWFPSLTPTIVKR
jgi:hypothetical protein